MQIDLKTLLFYTKPLIQKWLKGNHKAHWLFVAQNPPALALWQKRLKAKNVTGLALHDFQADRAQNEQYDGLVFIEAEPEPILLAAALSQLKPGGVCLLVIQNGAGLFPRWQRFLEEHHMVDAYPVGFHPKGAVAWWPWQNPLTLGLGQILDQLACFFPGRYETALRWGRCLLIRSLKRDDQTILI